METRRVEVYSSEAVLLGAVRMATKRMTWPVAGGDLTVEVDDQDRLVLPREYENAVVLDEDRRLRGLAIGAAAV